MGALRAVRPSSELRPHACDLDPRGPARRVAGRGAAGGQVRPGIRVAGLRRTARGDARVRVSATAGDGGMKAQRVDIFVCPSATPADTSGLQALADAGKLKPETLVALVGKTEGTGAHDDWGRVWADVALREWPGKFLGIPFNEVAEHVIFVLSGGCPGVITPHIAAVTREWVEVADERPGGDKRLVV